MYLIYNIVRFLPACTQMGTGCDRELLFCLSLFVTNFTHDLKQQFLHQFLTNLAEIFISQCVRCGSLTGMEGLAGAVFVVKFVVTCGKTITQPFLYRFG